METRVLSNLAVHGAVIMSKNETGFPENPVLGTMVIKDYCLYAYIQLGTMETWFPFSKTTQSYIHVQGLESSQWTVQHNLGTSDVWYQVTGPTGNIIMVGKTDIDENSFTLDFTSAVTGRCVVVAPETINVPQIKGSIVNVANGAVIIDSSGVLINGSYALTAANISQQIADAVAAKDNTDEITEGTTNLYFTNSRAQAAISVTDSGGDGSLSYNNTTGVITYTGPSATDVRAHFSAGTGVSISSGQISVDNTIATVSSLNSEITRATNAESTLTTNLNSEIANRTNAESTLTANILVEKTRAMNAESTLTSNLSSEISRAQLAEASLAASITSLGNAFNYVSSVSGGADSGSAYDLSALSQKDAGDYYKVGTAGYFKVGSGGTPFYANLNDGLVWNLSSGVDIIDNTNSSVSGTTNEITVTGSADSGFVVGLSSTFSSRMSTAESNINTEITRATNAESTLTANLNSEITNRTNADSTLTANLNSEITRASNAEATLTTNLNSEITNRTNAESTLTANLNSEITRATNAESTLNSSILTELSRAQAAEASLSSALAAEISRAQAAEASISASISTATINGGTY